MKRNKKGQFMKGMKPWNTDKKCPQISRALMGRRCSDEHKRRIGESKRGTERSLEARKKTSESLKRAYREGRRVPNKNKWPEEDRKKLSKIAKEKGFGKWMVGKKATEETLEKKRKWAKAHPEILRRSGYLGVKKQAEMKGPTSIEKKVYDELKTRGVLFEKQKLINGKFLVDAYIPSLNLVIEADGDYWHSLDRVKKRDKAKNAYLTKCGFGLLRLTGTEIRDNSFKEKLDKEVN